MQYITEGNDGFMFDVGSLYHWLEGLVDLRHRRGKRYPLPIALTMIILAKLAGQDEPRGIAGWLRHRRELICRYLNFGRQTTPHDRTIERIMAQAVEVEALDQIVGDYLLSIQTPELERGDTSSTPGRKSVVGLPPPLPAPGAGNFLRAIFRGRRPTKNGPQLISPLPFGIAGG